MKKGKIKAYIITKPILKTIFNDGRIISTVWLHLPHATYYETYDDEDHSIHTCPSIYDAIKYHKNLVKKASPLVSWRNVWNTEYVSYLTGISVKNSRSRKLKEFVS